MHVDRAIELLCESGLSTYEAKAYVVLLAAPGPLNGYEVAKASGVPRSTVYETLQKLVARGAATVRMTDEGGSEYTALSAGRFIADWRRAVDKTHDGLSAVLPEIEGPHTTSVLAHIHGRENVLRRFIRVIDESTEQCWLSLWSRGARELESAVGRAVERGVEVTSLVFGDPGDLPGRVIRHEYSNPDTVEELLGCLMYVAIGDQEQATIGIREHRTTWGIWSDDLLVVTLAMQYVYHDVSMQLMGQIGRAHV